MTAPNRPAPLQTGENTNTASPQTSFLSPEQVQFLEEAAKKREAEKMERINILSQRLSQEAVRRHGLRQSLEERWLEDLQQFNGIYDATTAANIKASEGSSVFINITRPKVKTAVARLSDMLFPTDDRNWDVMPTPVPELAKMLGSKKPLPPLEDGKQPMVPGVDGQERPATEADKAAMLMEKAKEAAKAMALEIDDQLTEAQYPSKCRRSIHDACLFGTGVVKGPVITGRTRRSWNTAIGKNGTKVRVLEQVADLRPGVEYVDIWNFFPDMAVSCMEENAATYERMFFTKNQLLRLAKQPGYLSGNVLQAAALGYKTSHLTRPPAQEKRDSASADGTEATDAELYEGWEYHGPLEPEDLRALGVEVEEEITEPIEACVVFVGGIVIKAYINPLETGDHIYHVFVYERDESSIFGFGVAYRMRHSQRILNAATRALMDNAALSTGPQVIVAKRFVQPADGNWTLKARKTWEMTDATKSVKDVMATFNIDSHQVELQAIIQLAERFADTETNLPLIAQGDQGANVTKTLGGMSLLNNNANVITRDTVKNWDDGITSRLIRAMYDWNMQNSDKEHIKGDFEVDARGSSVLLSKEIQAQNLMTLGANYSGHPVFGPMTKHLELYRKIVNAMHVAADDVVISDTDFQNYLNNQKDAPPDPAIQIQEMKAKAEQELLAQKVKEQRDLEDIRHRNRMMELNAELTGDYVRYASQERIKLDELKTLLGEAQISIQGKRQIQMDKLEFEARNPKPEKKPAAPGGKK